MYVYLHIHFRIVVRTGMNRTSINDCFFRGTVITINARVEGQSPSPCIRDNVPVQNNTK